MERRGRAGKPTTEDNQQWEEPMKKAKPFNITRQEVFDAYKRVKANDGAAGVDGESIEEFEQNLQDNLYKLWNRLSSGSYFPPPVRENEIDKKGGGQRTLGIPTVADRIAQAVVKARLEPLIDPCFHQDSYGYRPKKSALDAVGRARQRCWKYAWVLDLDIKRFFDTIDHALLMKAVLRHTSERWIILSIERWLVAPMMKEDGTLQERVQGTPQGGVISPLLANLFLHYVFDAWMRIQYPQVPFERYADDVIVHCRTEDEAERIRTAIELRVKECKLELHPEKTKIVYCKDSNRKERYRNEKFDFLGYTFRPRRAKNQSGALFTSFLPAISEEAEKSIREKIRNWKLYKRSGIEIVDISRMFNPVIRGWIQYYGKYYPSALNSWMLQLDRCIAKWVMCKYKRLRGRVRKAWGWMKRMKRQSPHLFAHWQFGKKGCVPVGAV
jgi:RNA-directed DNA polymerase